ncbi:hypothetical protein JJB07_08715 [Tumebacillus sp. ITR2]|uniref:Uncharacterized protein n=1 Tax=Tumebacillus amylolyticus TaxID=2801339 RepID=A0ABS1J8X4_9BACL|nr:hypothetical protein [Tumebacillus amylolyticus]MBL0386733.1 hypothetical protein [Tumebacillus amylolyticus]
MAKKRKKREEQKPLIQGFEKIPRTIEGVPLKPKVKKKGAKVKPPQFSEETVQESQGFGGLFWPGFPGLSESFRSSMVEYWKQFPTDVVPNTWLFSYNPPGFGSSASAVRFESPIVTGQKLFDDPFYTELPAPPLGEFDSAYPMWVKTIEAAQKRVEACPIGQESPECDAAREAYYAACRAYAKELDRVWGLQRFQDKGQKKKK